MNKRILLALALALGFKATAQTYSPVTISGYNADVVAEGTGAVSALTNNDVDGVNYNFMATGYTNPANATTTKGLPATGLITSAVATTTGLTYQLAAYNANNSLRINGTGNGMLTFGTATPAEKVYVLATSGSGTSATIITVTFTDNTTQVFTQTVNDWYGGAGFAIQGIGRVNRTDNTIDNNATDPRLYQYELALSIGNTTKPIQSISFSNLGSVLNVMGISIKNSAPPVLLDAGILAVTAPVTPVMQNTSQPVQVTVVNQGTTPLTSATITWTLDGVAQAPYAWTGNLALNQSAPVTLGIVTLASGSHTINACATSPNNGTDAFAANDCAQATLNSCNVLSGTFTIDKNSAVSPTNFQTIASAITAMSTCGISGPVTFNVVSASGPYAEQVEIPAIAGANATNTITFNGNGNTISADPVSATRHIIKLNGADYVTINNFTISTTGTGTSSYGWGIHLLNGADNNTISNNIITIGSTSSTESTSAGIVLSNSATSVVTTGNTGNNNLITGNTITGGYNGIVMYGQTTSSGNNQVTSNTIKDFYANGIKLGSIVVTLVENNNISRPTRPTVGTFAGVELNGSSRQNTISKNRIHTSHGGTTTLTGSAYGINSASNGAMVGYENIIKNNLIYNFGNTGTAYGFFNTGSGGIYYYHNTVNLNNTANTGNVRGFYQTTAANNIRFMNNNINILGGTSGAKHAIYYNTTTSNIRSNYNNLYVSGGASTSGIGFFTSNRATLADWQTGSGDDSVSVSADPLFVTGSFIPTVAALNNIGRPVTPAVTDDFTGAVRNTTNPDPGAYEFSVSAPATSDAGVSAITSPVSGCALTNQETITITINNFGTAALSNIPVSYTINNGTAVNETVTGPVAANSTATYSFTTKADLSVAGTYNIEARTNFTGDALATNDAFTKVVTATLAPAIPTITAGGATTFCSGGSVVLTAASATSGATYQWFNNGTAITGATSATYTANTAGNYTAIATASGCSSAASTATTVTVNTAPAVPTIVAPGPTSFCNGGSVTLTASTSTTGATFQWFNNGNAISGATAASYTANATGSYTVSATAGGCSSTSAATNVSVNASPAIPTITAGGATTFCTGGSVTLTAATTTSGATYSWFLNGTAITGATAATYSANAAGNYTVVADVNGCSSAASTATVITVNQAPTLPTINAGGATTFCQGGTVTLTATSTTTGVTYAWFLNGTAITGATTDTYSANAAGNYTVTATATAGGCSATSSAISVTVNPTPATPTISQAGFVLTSSSTTGNQWYLNGTPISGATNATYTTTANGSYTVIVSNNGCSSTASNAVNITTTGLQETQNLSLNIYPNPSNGVFNLNLPQGQVYELTVSDLTGKVLLQQTTKEVNTQLNLTNAAKGIYLLKLISNGESITRKLIVE